MKGTGHAFMTLLSFWLQYSSRLPFKTVLGRSPDRPIAEDSVNIVACGGGDGYEKGLLDRSTR